MKLMLPDMDYALIQISIGAVLVVAVSEGFGFLSLLARNYEFMVIKKISVVRHGINYAMPNNGNALGDPTSRVTTQRKIINFVGKMVKINKCCG